MAAAQDQLVQGLMRHDAKQFFVSNFDELFKHLVEMRAASTLPVGGSVSDKQVKDAIVTLHEAITKPEMSLTQQLAYIQLAQVLASLKSKIKEDCRKGVILRANRQRDATAVIKLYMEATGITRKEDVHGIIRTCNRYAALGKKVPLLRLVLSDDETTRIL